MKTKITVETIAGLLIVLSLMVILSGCIGGDKTVVTARATITETDNVSRITELVAEQHTASALEEYRENPAQTPGVVLHIIEKDSLQKISYWRSAAYTGPGEYKLTSELMTMPEPGESVNVIMKVVDENGDLVDSKTITIKWQ
ncbi:hypothetical protein B6V01_000055 [Methanosarcinales archaeon ex4572_44]|nr:MAG: hypothetical protein B6U67_01875 [Methanosarcinales archaeon ex4484_138]PHP46261.1 MAG: hypothetical protein B6V01_000055 [Methanosarcinales archaeon ex4572_44]RLG25752.1 MAG: hypothetical protein DRN85_04960 [Methanosarcinales archaeon]RLG28548.1 MAG: hypothetical protein DRN70_00345 [Methanosarcinales archaeon]HHI30468.1 hypothetical protein [Candidatus Methanoperedenaceae archaeon]